MGDSITEGTLQSWQKQVGESVQVDEVVAVIETDKVRAAAARAGPDKQQPVVIVRRAAARWCRCR